MATAGAVGCLIDVIFFIFYPKLLQLLHSINLNLIDRCVAMHLRRCGRWEVFRQLLIDDGVLGGQKCLAIAFVAAMHDERYELSDHKHQHQHADNSDKDWCQIMVRSKVDAAMAFDDILFDWKK